MSIRHDPISVDFNTYLAAAKVGLQQGGDSPELTQWPWLEAVLLIALLAVAWRPLTAWGDSRRRAPA